MGKATVVALVSGDATMHLTGEEIEFLRWRAERWLKLRHLPTALLHSPGFAVRHGMQVLAIPSEAAHSGHWWGSRTSGRSSRDTGLFERRNGRMCEGPWRHSA